MAGDVTIATMQSEQSKVILITGASSGIGESAVRALLEAGHRVHGAARRLEKMKPLEELGASIHHLDVTEEESIKKVVDEILEKEERIDVLINNAGFGLYGAVEEVTIGEARHQFDVNLFGLARMTQLVLPAMREKRSGTIINISSVGGKIYTPLGAWYHATKHAIEGWSDCLRIELDQFGIHVVIVEPGAIETEFDVAVVDPLLKRSGDGAYAGLAEKMAAATRNTFASGKASPPGLIAGVLVKAVASERPKTRYVAGFLAKPMILARRLLSDRMFDRMIRKFL